MMKEKNMPEEHHCQMDCDIGAIRADYDPKKCCGVPTDHYFVYRKKRYYLCAVHLSIAGLLAMGYVVGVDGTRT